MEEKRNPVVKYDNIQTFTFRALFPGAKPLPYLKMTLTDKYQITQEKLTEYQDDALDKYIDLVRGRLASRVYLERWWFTAVQICQRFAKMKR